MNAPKDREALERLIDEAASKWLHGGLLRPASAYILTAIEAAGYAVVPVDATDDMTLAKGLWRAMLAASPCRRP